MEDIQTSSNSAILCHNSGGVKYLIRPHFGFSHFQCHIFKHSFQETLNPLCSCSHEVDTTHHFSLNCTNFANDCCYLLKNLYNIESSILDHGDNHIVQTFLYENTSFIEKTIGLF